MAKKKKDSAALVKKEVRDCRYWCEHQAEDIKDRSFRKIPLLLEANDFDSAKVIGNSLESLGIYYGQRGCLAIMDGNQQGWEEIDHAACYYYWNAKMSISVIFKGLHQGIYAPVIYHEMPNIASLLCYDFLYDLKERWKETWQSWLKLLATPAAVLENYWDEIIAGGQYEIFVTRMFIESDWGKGEKLPNRLAKHSLGPYQAVLDAWRDPEALAEPLRGSCDYHCQRITQNPRYDPYPPFGNPPFSLFPVEILAIYKLRAEQGLETPEIEHPLLELPTASREPRQAAKIDDPLFPKLQKLHESQCLA